MYPKEHIQNRGNPGRDALLRVARKGQGLSRTVAFPLGPPLKSPPCILKPAIGRMNLRTLKRKGFAGPIRRRTVKKKMKEVEEKVPPIAPK